MITFIGLIVREKLQIYEVLLDSWKDPAGAEEFFRRLEDNSGQNLTSFSEPSIQLMVFWNEEKQPLSVGARQAVDTVLSLLVNESFLKKDLPERRCQIEQILDSFDFSAEELTQMEGFKGKTQTKVSLLYDSETSAALRNLSEH